MEARWFLGKALAQVEREPGPGRGIKKKSSGFTSFLTEVGLTMPTAIGAQRLATLPEAELKKAFTVAHKEERLSYLNGLIEIARPLD